MPNKTDSAANDTAQKRLISGASWSARRHLTDTKDLSIAEVSHLLEQAKHYREKRNNREALHTVAPHATLANLFYENSTRTRSSFELAAKTLGMTVLNLDVNASSVAKGETIEDTARTLLAMGTNVIVQRHSASGSAQRIVEKFGDRLHVVNAGDGTNAHPTQALLDLLTMSEIAQDMEGKKVAIIGDILHSRVARSNIWLLKKFGVELNVCGPETLMPKDMSDSGVHVHKHLKDALSGVDFIIALRLQFERQQAGLISSIEEYTRDFGLDHESIKPASPKVRVLHPGPINRGVEISDALADDAERSLIDKQVANGVAIRMAVLAALTRDD